MHRQLRTASCNWGYLGSPLKTEQRVEEVNTLTGEKPGVERAGYPRDIACWRLCLFLVIPCHRLLELVDQLEEVVEVIAWQVIQEELKLRVVMLHAKFLAITSYDADHF